MATITVLYVGIDFSQLADEIQRHQVPREPSSHIISALFRKSPTTTSSLAALVATALRCTADRVATGSFPPSKASASPAARRGHLPPFHPGLRRLVFVLGETYLPLSNRKCWKCAKHHGQALTRQGGRFFRGPLPQRRRRLLYRYSATTNATPSFTTSMRSMSRRRRPGPPRVLPQAQFQAGRWVTPEAGRGDRRGPCRGVPSLKDAVSRCTTGRTLFRAGHGRARMMNAFQLAGLYPAPDRWLQPGEWQVRFWQKLVYPVLALLVLLALVSTLGGLHGGSPWRRTDAASSPGCPWAAVAVCASWATSLACPSPSRRPDASDRVSPPRVHRLLGLRS